MKKSIFICILLYISLSVNAQTYQIKVQNQENIGMSRVYILDTLDKTLAITDSNGIATLTNPEYNTYKVKSIGYFDKTFELENEGITTVTLIPKIIKGVEIKENRKKSAEMVGMDMVTLEDLGKLACCNIAESFENSNTVDVSYSDGVTGTREIKMLGLAGVYSQQLMESTPYFRGIMSKVGLEMIPGPWMSSVAVNKGAGSVVNGYENITGQININFFTPRQNTDWMLNAYISEIAKSDVNFVKAFELKPNLYTSLFAHTSFSLRHFDNNNDGFQDMPVFTNFNLMNKWQYIADNGFVLNAAIQGVRMSSETGQWSRDETLIDPYRVKSNYTTFQLMLKTAWLLDAVKESSFAIKTRANYSLQDGNLHHGEIDNKEAYANISPLYVTNINDLWKMNVGGQFIYDNVKEKVDTLGFSKNELVGGAFGEFTYDNDVVMMIFGGRLDYHNTLGLFATPRATFRFNVNEEHIFKASGGLGFRTPALLTETFNYLVSNRSVSLPDKLEAEKALNTGFSYRFNPNTDGWNFYLEAGAYLTFFQNQLIYNVETPEVLKVSYLKNNSNAQSYQIETGISIGKNWDIKLAYKYDDNKILFDSVKKSIPLLKNHKVLANLSWKSNKDKFRLSTTLLVNGSSRLPANAFQGESYSPFYPIWHAQFSYLPIPKLDLYIGAENILSYNQKDRIISYNDVNNPAFDAAMIWGPLDRRRMYVGVKWAIPSKSKVEQNNSMD